MLSSERLLQTKGIGKDAGRFINKCGERVQIRTVTDSYSRKVREFYEWYLPALEANTTPALVDYRRCKKVCLQTASRTWHRAMVHHYIEWKVDPYAHLDKYLTPDEIDEHGACDDELRGMIYKLFGVNLGKDIAKPTIEK